MSNKRGKQQNQNKTSKQQERMTRRELKRLRQRRSYGDSEWKQDFEKFMIQLQTIGLTIKDVAGDGNCLFRALADQIEGDPNKHATYRKRICDYIEDHKFDYAPFIEDDETFEEYISGMRKNATWGGQMEIQAFSLLFGVNVTIHQLGQPRWDVINLPPDHVKTVHLSYHQGEHYSSVRKIGDLSGIPSDINLHETSKSSSNNNKKPQKSQEKDNKPQYIEEEQTVMIFTGCSNREFVRELLAENWGDINACIDFIMTIGSENIEFQEEYVQEKRLEKELKSYEAESKYFKKQIDSNHNNNNNSDNNNGFCDHEPENNDYENSSSKRSKNHPQKKPEDRQENSTSSTTTATLPTSKNKRTENIDPIPQSSVHPKLAKFNVKPLSNKERKELNQKEREIVQPPPQPKLPPPTTMNQDPQISDVVQDLGSMQI